MPVSTGVTRAAAQAQLEALFAGAPVANLAQLMALALDATKLVDPDGHAPGDPAWVETYDVWLSAGELAESIALQLAINDPGGKVTQFSSEGSSFTLSSGSDWRALAAWLRSRSTWVWAPRSGSLGVIELDRSNGFIPRSEGLLPGLQPYRPRTGDPYNWT